MEKLLDRMPCSLWFILTNPYNFAGIPTLPKILVVCVSHLNEVVLIMHGYAWLRWP